MDISKQVCTLEQAKRLKELGVNQNSLFYIWFNSSENPVFPKYCYGWDYDDIVNEHYAAYTVAELGVMLPDEYMYRRNLETLMFHWTDDAFGEGRRLHFSNIMIASLQEGYETEAECRADALIWLLEKAIITPEQVDQRLNG